MAASVAVDSHPRIQDGPQSPSQAGSPPNSSPIQSPPNPFQSPSTAPQPENGSVSEKNSSSRSKDGEDPHDYRPHAPTDSRSPCPALNALANHGYLPRDGRNIDHATLLKALQHKDTYHLTPELAEFLAKGGALMTDKTLLSKLSALFDNDDPLSLHDLAVHKKTGVEHNASVTHKNAPWRSNRAPIGADPALVDEFCRGRESIDLEHVALSRVKLELASEIDPLHAEIARGEWALVLDIFKNAYDGKIPVEALRTWLLEWRFPEGWKPGCEQTLPGTVETSRKIRKAMEEFRMKRVVATEEEIQKLRDMLTSVGPYDRLRSIYNRISMWFCIH